MENKIQESIQSVMHTFIHEGNHTVIDCFKQICMNLGLTHEFNILLYMEKINANNSEISEFNARYMYSRAADLCTQNAKLYTAIEQEKKSITIMDDTNNQVQNIQSDLQS